MKLGVLIVFMMLGTMIPRILPFYAFKSENLHPLLRSFLNFIPYSVLGALILPAGLYGIQNKPIISGICLIVAGIIAWLREDIVSPVICAVISGILLVKLI